MMKARPKIKTEGIINSARISDTFLNGDAMYVIPIELKDPIEFKPGQFANITAVIDGEKVTRSYSILSIEDDTMEIYFNVVENGKMSPWLTQAMGQTLEVIAPFGGMTIKHFKPNKVFISAGTGIAPFVPMINQIIDEGNQITLLHSNKFKHEATFDDHFRLLDEKFNNFTFIPTLTREDDDNFIKGRVTDFPKLNRVFDPDAEYYICGMPDMIMDVETYLLSKNIELKHIISEKYV